MLESSFLHFDGIGTKREREFWRSNVFSWAQMPSVVNKQLHFPFDDESPLHNSPIQQYYDALDQGDADFFAQKLKRREHYRIALTFPSDTMFLDIETTGLSRYYHEITLIGWSIGDKYNVLINGDPTETFYTDLAKAKAIVTFNGIIFDIPFILKAYPNAPIPSTHVDLRFLSKRVGLTGGQKEIERKIGKSRSAEISEIIGETAPLLWYRYRHGDESSLRDLIKYNHADIEGMKRIFDVAVRKLWKNEKIPTTVSSKYRFAKAKSKINWESNKTLAKHGIVIQPYNGQAGPKIHIQDLYSHLKERKIRIVGIDLSGGEKRPSGWCLLDDVNAVTKLLYTDTEIVEATEAANPLLVSIDSPLSLPEGRISVDDDDPGRNEFGIMRRCERILKKRGINVYPSLIPSMQKLTERGIRLATLLRSKGIPVIESYPGAAQDIMDIPRKRASTDLLAFGLQAFGIHGTFLDDKVTHDELDAITSAVVGAFFWTGKFEGLGDEVEEYLIIPDLNSDPSTWRSRKVIGISGRIAAGKTTAGKHIEQQGFNYGRFSQILEKVLSESKMKITRENLQKIGQNINQEKKQRWLGYQIAKACEDKDKIVIDGMRHPEDYSFLVETFGPGFKQIHIETNEEIRRTRYIDNGHSNNEFSDASKHQVEQNICLLKNLAHKIVKNNAAKAALYVTLDAIIQESI